MSKLFLLEPGFVEPSVIYEVQLKEVARLERATVDDICNELDRLNVQQVVIDAGYPPLIERVGRHFMVKKIMRRPPKEKPYVK
jgi:hypothetical protein